MLTLVLILIVVACVLLTLVVLIQNPKGGGIASNFVAPNQIMGVKRSTDVVEKATWILAVALIVLSLSSNFFRPTDEVTTTNDSRLKDAVEEVATPAPQAPPPGAAQQPEQAQQPAQETQAQPDVK
jgi:preprotein translocase subunit SecG